MGIFLAIDAVLGLVVSLEDFVADDLDSVDDLDLDLLGFDFAIVCLHT
jgi:hypothetical protein